MLDGSERTRELLKEISSRVVDAVAPEELDLFDELAQEYFETPPKELKRSVPSDEEAGGFGLAGMPVGVSTVALAAAQAVLAYLLTEVIPVVKEETSEQIRLKLRAVFEKKEASEAGESPTLTPEQLEHIKKMARKQAREFGMETAEARKMANALVGVLATM